MPISAFVFPGQGAQFVGMGKEAYEMDAQVKNIFDQADEIFANFHRNNTSIKKLSEVCFNGPEELLQRTVYTQPGILVLSIALATLLKNKISLDEMKAPKYVAGHSLGEFSALYMSGVLSLKDTIELVVLRAALMEQAPEGAMAAVIGLQEDEIKMLVDKLEQVSVANYNAPDQIVITGTSTGIARSEELINNFAKQQDKSARFIQLKVGGAFHSSLMAQAAAQFADAIDKVNFNDASIPIIQNFSAQASVTSAEIKINLKQQMTGAVRWTQTVRFLLDDNVKEVFEVGPGKVLAGLIKKQDRRFPVNSISDINSLNSLFALKT